MGSTGITIPLYPVHSARWQRVDMGSTAQCGRDLCLGRSRHRGDRIGTAVDTTMNPLDKRGTRRITMPRYSAPMIVKKPQAISVAPFEDVIKCLPLRRNYQKSWHPTQTSPCPLLMQCTKCKEYLPTGDFYVKRTRETARRDILGQNHTNTCIYCSRGVFPTIDPRRKLYYSAKARAVKKNLEFKISIADIVIPERCPVFGIRLKSGAGGGTVSVAKLESSPTLDRVDNSKGYTPDNVCVISLRANNLKRDATLYEMQCLAYHMAHPPGSQAKDVSSLMNQIVADNTAGKLFSDAHKRYLDKDHRERMIAGAKKRKKLYGFDDSLAAQDIVIPRFCPVLGIELRTSVGLGSKTLENFYYSPSIDRIDCSKGYTKENIQIISFRANCLKRDASLWEIRALAGYMKDFGEGTMWQPHCSNDTNGGDE